jgi:hypothetical protein
MNSQSLHRQFECAVAKQVGFMPTYWQSLTAISLSNDREPGLGSVEDRVE